MMTSPSYLDTRLHLSSSRLQRLSAVGCIFRSSHLVKKLVLTVYQFSVRRWRPSRINSLPAEIVLEIIRYACWSPGDAVKIRTAITSICRWWRELALGDSTLWSVIHFHIKDHPFERCYLWLTRAGNAPLRVWFDDGPVLGYRANRHITDPEMQALLKHLFPSIYRIQTLFFVIYNWPPLLTFVKRLHAISQAGRPLILEELEIHRSGNLHKWPTEFIPIDDHPVEGYPVIGRHVTPKLDSICLDGIHFDWRASNICNLTSLDLRRLPLELSPSLSEFRSMLQSSPHLLRLHLSGAGPNVFFDPTRDLPPIHLEHLKTLVLCNFAPTYAQGIVQNISAPVLKELQITKFMRHDYRTFWSYMTGLFPSVVLLSLTHVDIAMPDAMGPFVRFLASMPRVRYLCVSPITPGAVAAFLCDSKTALPHPAIPARNRALFKADNVPNMDIVATPPSSDADGVVPVFPELEVFELCRSCQW